MIPLYGVGPLPQHLAACGWPPAVCDAFTGDFLDEDTLRRVVGGSGPLSSLARDVHQYATAPAATNEQRSVAARVADRVAGAALGMVRR